MDFEDYGDFGDDGLFDDKDKPTEVLNDDDVLNSVIKKTEPKDGKKKRTVTSKPRPKLTEHTLTGPKGLCALRNLFEKWNPHENRSPYDNLEEMMQKVEYWGHLLYPKSNFDDLLAKVEQLGKKRAVKVYMTKLRLGMPLFEELDEKEGEKMNDRRSVSPVDKPLSSLPDDEDDFNDEAWDRLFDDPSPKETPIVKKKSKKRSELKKRLHKLVADSDDESSPDDEMDEDSALNSIFNDAIVPSKNTETTMSPKGQKQKLLLDSDEEKEEEDSLPQALSDKENVPSSYVKQKSQSKKLIIDSDDEEDASTQESESNKRPFKKDDMEQEKLLTPSESPVNKKRRIIIDSSDEDEEEPPTSVANSERLGMSVLEELNEKESEKINDQHLETSMEKEFSTYDSTVAKKRRIIIDSDDEDVVVQQQSPTVLADSISEETALDLIFDD
uniref:TIMELESS-interacting protein n=1 Tax=Panagrolaimus sp. PS1159 TaxID=55785 RepID=A0AC35G7K1_9BILA